MLKMLKNSNLLEIFAEGNFNQVLDLTYNQTGELQARYIPSVVGALTFVGRSLEADKVYLSKQKTLSEVQKSLCLFFLSIALTRKSKYDDAEKVIETLRKLSAKKDPSCTFYFHQASAFLLFFQGRISECSEHVEKALAASIESEDLYARSLATDILGHCKVRMGFLHQGLSLMQEAYKILQRLKNKSGANANELAQLQYRVHYGLEISKALASLESQIAAIETEDSYTLSMLGLELARQRTLRGQFEAAEKILKKISIQILSSENLRYEILLNLRWSELCYQRGDWIEASHYLRAARRCLQSDGTAAFEIQTLGLELKLAKALDLKNNQEEKQKRLLELSKISPSIMNTNLLCRIGLLPAGDEAAEDEIHQIFRAVLQKNEKCLSLIQDSGLWTLYYEALELSREKSFLYWNTGKGLYLLNTKRALTDLKTQLTPLSLQILAALAKGPQSKEELCKIVWGFQYDVLRHDKMIYSAISQLRASLGFDAEIIETTETGYRLDSRIQTIEIASENPDRPVDLLSMSEFSAQNLNLRQIQALKLFQKHSWIDSELYQGKMKTKRLMASRDLRLLTELGYIKRIGRGRATRYILAKEIV